MKVFNYTMSIAVLVLGVVLTVLGVLSENTVVGSVAGAMIGCGIWGILMTRSVNRLLNRFMGGEE